MNMTPTSWISLAVWIVALIAIVIWGQTFRNRQRNLMGSMNIMFAVSALMLVLSVGSLAVKGLNYGLDFTGGTIIEIGSYQQLNVDNVGAALAEFKEPELGDRIVQVGEGMITPANGGKPYQKILVRVTRATPTAEGGKELKDDEPGKLFEHLKTKLGDMEKLSTASIGPTITGELKWSALQAVVLALLLQCGYIWLRFGNQLKFGVAADLAIIHDVVIMLGLYSLSGRQLDSPFVAALLTVAGYSVMDSVVIFDRIRENAHLSPNKPFPVVVNESVNQTMTRSINTTLTVVITILAIYFFGGSTLQNFAFALLVGIISGAYSSICVASPLLIVIDRWDANRPKPAVEGAPAPSTVGKVAESAPSSGEGPKRRRRGTRSKSGLPGEAT